MDWAVKRMSDAIEGMVAKWTEFDERDGKGDDEDEVRSAQCEGGP